MFREGATGQVLAAILLVMTTGVCTWAVVDGTHIPDESAYAPGQIIIKFKQGVANALEEQLAERTRLQDLTLSASLDALNRTHEVQDIQPIIPGFKAARERIDALLAADSADLTYSERRMVRRLSRAPAGAEVPDMGRIYKIDLAPAHSAPDAAAEYSRDGDVEYAELNYLAHALWVDPVDPCYPVQWPLANTGQMYPSPRNPGSKWPPGGYDCDIDANEAWEITTGSSDVIVAVIDGGGDYTHRDLQNNMWTEGAPGPYGYDFWEYDSEPMDENGHGTHCAGIIAADANNAYDIAGVSWKARIMAVRSINAVGGGYTSDQIVSVLYAVHNGADILSCSWRINGQSEALREAMDYAYSQGAVVVAAAGNFGSEGAVYPAYYDSVISVAATDSNDDMASFSTYGDWVNIAAPGVDILSLRANGTSRGTVQNEYLTVLSGTSMACPHVSGACALLLSVNPYMTPDDVNDILMATADELDDPNVCRSGRLNVREALLAAVPSKGYVSLDRDYYNSDCNIVIMVADYHLKGGPEPNVTVITGDPNDPNDSVTMTLTETQTNSGIFTGTLSTDSSDPNSADALLQVSHGDTITATYQDANDGNGGSSSVTDVAEADCVAPTIISNVNVIGSGPEVTVTFETNEAAGGRVRYGTSCGDPCNSNIDWATEHSIRLYADITTDTNYYFTVEALDLAGNITTDTNDSNCYTFTTDHPTDINVPADYNSIQDAIDNSSYWLGSRVTVGQGTYYEAIDFKGRPLILTSADPNDWDVVTGTVIQAGPNSVAVTLNDGQGGDPVLRGFTLTGSMYGVFANTRTSWVIGNCIISNNEIDGIAAHECSSPTIHDTMVFGNGHDGVFYHGAAFPVLKNNAIFNNAGSGLRFIYTFGRPVLTNNTIVANAEKGVWGSAYGVFVTSNSIIWENGDDLFLSTANYSCISDPNDASGTGNISGDANDPMFVNIYNFRDVTDANGEPNTLVMADGGEYDVNDVIEYDNDSIVRTIQAIDANTITFSPALGANSVAGVVIFNWGIGVTDVNEDFHLQADSPCIDAGDPNGDYSGQTDIDGDPRLMCTADMGADEAECFPSDLDEYDDWVALGKPDCWCYCWPYQCDGDADGQTEDPNTYRIYDSDLDLVEANWQKTITDPTLNPCADIDHEGQVVGWRVYTNDLSYLE